MIGSLLSEVGSLLVQVLEGVEALLRLAMYGIVSIGLFTGFVLAWDFLFN